METFHRRPQKETERDTFYLCFKDEKFRVILTEKQWKEMTEWFRRDGRTVFPFAVIGEN